MIYRIVLFAILISSYALSKGLHYTVDLRTTKLQRVSITVEMEQMGAEVVYYQMPAWAPGAYAMTNYGRFVENFKAVGYDGKEKPVMRIDVNRWQILHGKDIRHISYEVTNSYKDSTSLYFALAHFDSNFVFANATALFGYVNDKKDLPSSVTYLFPAQWDVQTALDSVAGPLKRNDGSLEWRFRARNYDELADAPIMAGPNFQYRSFRLGKALFDIVVASDKPFAMDSIAYYTKRIAEAQLDFFRDTPFVRYKLLINAPTYYHLPRKDQGALEHKTSSGYLLINAPWNYVKSEYCHIISHELFHIWNVKQIHSKILGPFDYTKPVKTKELWFAEGVTDYYSHLLLVRYHILPVSTLASMLNYLYEAVDNSSFEQSLEALSLEESNFDIENALQFYTRGTLVGFMLDVELRSRSNNRTSLDQVMRVLNTEAKRGKHYADDKLASKIGAITKIDIHDFYHQFIGGTSALAVDEYLLRLGMARRIRLTEKWGIDIQAELDSSTRYLIIDSLRKGSPLSGAGVVRGDTILAIAGEPASPTTFESWRATHNAPYTTRLLLGTAQGRREETFTFLAPWQSSTRTLEAGVIPETTAQQDQLRHAIFGNHFNFVGWQSDSSLQSFEINTPRPRDVE